MSTERASEDEILAPGNPIRLRGLPVVFGGLVTGVVAMAAPVGPAVMLVVGGVGALSATWGTLDLLGTFDDEPARGQSSARELAAPLLVIVLAALLGWLALRAAVAGTLTPLWAAFTIPATMIAAIVGVFRLLERLGPMRRDEAGALRPLHRRHGFWLLVIAILLHVPLLGSHSLTDPWETHYGEVSREILARGDWITLWWAEDGWFQSKPVLTFWLQAASMALSGVRFEPGQMLGAVGAGGVPHPEWALRMPSVVAMLGALYVLYRGVARTCGRRAGFLGGVALVTMPQFFLVSRQAMTDMPFVAGVTATLGFVLLAANVDPERRARAFALPIGSVSLFHAVFGAVLLLVFLQVCYLASRNLMIATEPYFDVRFVGDTFAQGSPGNCGSPGNAKCVSGLLPEQDRIQPAVQALIWLQATALLLWLSWGERRQKRLLYLAAWLCAALASMSKGIGGLALPLASAFLWVMATGRWRELTRMEIIGGLLLFAVTALPWFAASYVRHGWVFIERLFFEHMVKRTFGEMHQTNKGDDVSFRYYVWQLGYATFPWSGLAPVALVSWLRRREDERWSTACLMAASFAVGFVLFSLMGTKFHHYCLPVLPPLAMLVGILLDDLLQRPTRDLAWGGALVGAAIATVFVGVDLAWQTPGRLGAVRLLQLFTYKYSRPWPEHLDFSGALWGFTIAAGVAVFALVVKRRRRVAVALLGVVAVAFALWTVDVYMIAAAPHWGQRELIVRYETERVSAPGDLVAYQMNWKGENFYRGNAVPAFKTTGGKFQQWIDDRKREGQRTFYFLTEHTRVSSLKAELGGPRDFDKLTDEKLNNKFTLLRAKF